ADQVYAAINSQRASNGLAPLVRLQTAELEARLHARDMANRDYLNHSTMASSSPVVPDPERHPEISFTGGMGPAERLRACGYTFVNYGWGENIAYNWGYGTQSPDVAVTSWMNSPGHRANILNPGFQGTGVGCAQSDSGAVYYCQVFVVYTAGQPTVDSSAGGGG